MKPYYRDDHVTLYHGDAAEILPDLPDGSVDHTITDPPYSEHVHNVKRVGCLPNDRAGTARTVDLGFTHLTPELREVIAAETARLTLRWVLAFCDVESAHHWADDLDAAGLDYVRTGAWIKLGCTPQFSGDRPAVGHEAVVICHQPGRKRWNGGGKHAVWSYPIVLDRGRNGARLHTTQKPEALMLALVDQFTDPSDVILDPFAGSGTTLAAARRLGRRAIGVEQNERYCEVIARRLDQGVLDLGDGT